MTMMTAVTYVKGDGRLQCITTFRPEICSRNFTCTLNRSKPRTINQHVMTVSNVANAAQTPDFLITLQPTV